MRRAWWSLRREQRGAFAARGVLVGLLAVAGAAAAAAQKGPTAILNRVQVNPRRAIDFHAAVMSDSVFVGQQATYQVAVLLSPEARSRLRRNPEFLPPELRGLLAYELGTPTRVAPQSYAGAVFEAHVFQRALFPVAAGVQVVPAPQLTYALPQSSSYFSREERFMVRAESASFVVKPLPVAGRPDDFNGAVGQFTSGVRLDSAVARVGDPLILTLRVQGIGNVKLLPRPVLELNWATVVAGSERIQVDSAGALVRGTKEFDWILTPARDGRVTVPALRYSYFDPYAAQYAVAESAPVELSVKSGTLAVVEEGEGADVMPLRALSTPRRQPVWNGRRLPPPSWFPWVAVALLAPCPAAWAALRARRVRRGAVVKNIPRRLEPAVAAAEMPRDAVRQVRRNLLVSLAERFSQSPQAIVSRAQLARVLRRAGVTQATTREIVTLLDRLDAVGFADLNGQTVLPNADAAQREAEALLRDIESQALPRGRELRDAILILMLLSTLAGVAAPRGLRAQSESREQGREQSNAKASVVASRDSSAVELIAAARRAYAQRAYVEATERFGQVAKEFPADANVLTNWGTAAWAANDTVTAVIAWQRAARLEPMATDVTRRLGVLPAGARGGIADVPMIPVPWLLRIALALWVAGWLIWSGVFWRAAIWRASVLSPTASTSSADESQVLRVARRAALVLVLGGTATGASAWWGIRRLDAERLYVVSRPETLRIAPGSDADAMGGVSTGDVVAIDESRPLWRRVQHADGRRGWLPSARLVAISPYGDGLARE